jgi:anti-sigma regulatory factor (Ser/Thr protein kinase)
LDHALTAELPNLHLTLSNRRENVSLVRDVLTGYAEAVELPHRALEDIKAAVTEACNNVVLHAYAGQEGPLEIELFARSGAILVVVRDRGAGICPDLGGADESGLGIGLRMIRALVDSVDIGPGTAPGSERPGGTEVRMQFAVSGARPLEHSQGDGFEPAGIAASELSSTVSITLVPARLAVAVLPRLLSLLAARVELPGDRVSDAQRVGTVLAGYARQSGAGGQVSVRIRAQLRGLELLITPLRTDLAKDLAADAGVDGPEPVVAWRAEGAPAGSGQTLLVRLVDGPSSTSAPVGVQMGVASGPGDQGDGG